MAMATLSPLEKPEEGVGVVVTVIVAAEGVIDTGEGDDGNALVGSEMTEEPGEEVEAMTVIMDGAAPDGAAVDIAILDAAIDGVVLEGASLVGVALEGVAFDDVRGDNAVVESERGDDDIPDEVEAAEDIADSVVATDEILGSVTVGNGTGEGDVPETSEARRVPQTYLFLHSSRADTSLALST